MKEIQLSDEILSNCNKIEKIADGLFEMSILFDYKIRIIEGKKGYTSWVQNTLLSASIDYLNQLQEFYKLLTGDELIFEL